MRSIKALPVVLLIILSVFVSCDKEETEPTDQLDQYGILGKWKLETRTINGITDLSIQCCDYIEFKLDDEPGDLKGKFTATGTGYETNGVFELNTSNSTIHFDYDNTQKSYEIQISGNVTTFTYVEDNNDINEDWRKEE